ncbi:ATP-binding protein [Maridesulfovibrio sp.]|uniref:ATP-binding protein n=1 Tax=Maridesulfovibrio sp. TaxID=2795000 RepID=UPI002A18D48E|nr:ATP-binding protein [Maridesulfovibrio sp.]
MTRQEAQGEDCVVSQFSLKSDISELKVLAERIECFGEENSISPKTVFELNLVLDELFTNLVNYGCHRESHSFDITILLSGGILRIYIEDDGKQFNPLRMAEPEISCDCMERKIGGLGIHFMRKMMDEVEYAWENGKNKLKLTKNIQ